MRRLSKSNLVRAAAVAAVVVLLVFAATGIGPDVPGPSLSTLLKKDEPYTSSPCVPKPSEIRSPSTPPQEGARWRREEPLPDPHDEMAAVLAGDGKIYIGGGVAPKADRSNYRSLDGFFSFDPKSDTYRREGTLPNALDHVVAQSYGREVYYVGGFHDAEPEADAWRYSPASGRWSKLTPMKVPRGAAGGAVIGDKLYVVGGARPGGEFREPRNGDEVSKALEIYDFKTGRWSSGPDMPTARHHLGVAAVDGKLYAVGGRGFPDFSLDAFERFDPATRRWEKLPPLPQGSGGLRAVAANGELIAMGGGDDLEHWATGAVWAFNPASGEWRRLRDLSEPRHGLTAVLDGGRIYVFGGSPCWGYGIARSVESLKPS